MRTASYRLTRSQRRRQIGVQPISSMSFGLVVCDGDLTIDASGIVNRSARLASLRGAVKRKHASRESGCFYTHAWVNGLLRNENEEKED